MATVIRMPEVLTGATEAALQSWLVAVGDTVAVGQPLAEVETEKATVEYEAEAGGTVASLLIDTGVQVSVGTPIAVLAADGETIEQALASADVGAVADDNDAQDAAAQDAAAQDAAVQDAVVQDAASAASESVPAEATASTGASMPAATATGATPTTAASPEPAGRDGHRIFMSPLVRRLAAERGLDLSTVAGTGPGGRIVRRDLDKAPAVATGSTHPDSAVVDQGAAEFDLVAHTGMRRAIARRLVESKSTIPHFYLVADIRVDALLDLRAQLNTGLDAKVSLNDLIVKAVACAHLEVPEANATWSDEGVRRYRDVDIAIAVALDDGLITPVLRAVNRLPVREVSERIRELATRARAGQLKQLEIEGGSFSVSNLGMYGTAEFSAIINPPHSGILAVGAARKAPVVEGETLAVGTVMTVTLSADHRVLDGALAAQWLAALQALIENPVRILL